MKLLVFLLLPCLSLSEVGKDFRQCKEYLLYGVPPKFTPSQIPTANPLLTLSSTGIPPQFTVISTAHICQCLWDDYGQQKYLYATLYNTAWRIPVYSAYVFGSASTGRCDPWYIEPQLYKKDADPCMAPQGRNTAIGNNQALNRDYKGSNYDKGHLYPVQHTDNPLFMLGTSTLTNAAPQDPDFNQGAWKNHEAAVINDLNKRDQGTYAYVVTGVVPDLSKNINNRVTVSKYYWRATCCLKNGVPKGQGYFGPDNNLKVQTLTIADLQNKLAKDYGVNIVIFPGVSKTDCN